MMALYSFIIFLLSTVLSEACEQKIIDVDTTPEPVSSSCGHSRYFHADDTPGVGIMGGSMAKENEFPWIVRLSESSGLTVCAASIIDNYWLLTAAHCVADADSLTAHFADHYTYSSDSGELSWKISKSVVHPKYKTWEKDYDFALLRLPSALDFSHWNVQKVCLPTSCSDNCSVAGQPAFIAGWGSREQYGETTNHLRKAQVFLISQKYCRQVYSTNELITDNMLCAGVDNGGIDACKGDSGGPLVINEEGFFKLCGVTSFGEGCGHARYPGVYARVCSVLTWIHEYI